MAMDDVLAAAAQPRCPECGTALRTRAYGLYCGGCKLDVLDVGTGESIGLSALAAELGHTEHRLGMRIYHYVRRKYPEHRPGDPWLLTPEQADDVRRNVR
jgi:hypothetical protein